MSIERKGKDPKEAAMEVRDIYREMAQELHCHYSPTSEAIAILTLATVIAINANPVYIVDNSIPQFIHKEYQ